MTHAEQTCFYRVLRPLWHGGKVQEIGEIIELTRSTGVSLVECGRVEPKDGAQADDPHPVPCFRPVAPGIVRVQR